MNSGKYFRAQGMELYSIREYFLLGTDEKPFENENQIKELTFNKNNSYTVSESFFSVLDSAFDWGDSSWMVTGPSLVIPTSIIAPNLPSIKKKIQ